MKSGNPKSLGIIPEILSNNSEDILSELCREFYLTYNLKNNCRFIASRTSSVLNWKDIKKESLKKLYGEFIHKNNEKCD